MTYTVGPKGKLDFTTRAHRNFVRCTLAKRHLPKRGLFDAMSPYFNDDVLSDHPDSKMHFARFVLFVARNERIKVRDMKWFKKCADHADVDGWYPEDCYGVAAAYGRVVCD